MVAHPLRDLPPLTPGRARRLPLPAAALGLSLTLAACGADRADLADVVAREGLSSRAVVRLEEWYAVSARSAGARVEVVSFRRELSGWKVRILASSDPGGEELVQLMSMGGETGEEWNSFVYGRAGPSVSRVELEGRTGAGGHVTDGTWVIALRDKDVTPDELAWRFVAPDGAVIRSGIGLL